MKTELIKLQRLKSYCQIKIYTEIRASFHCIFAQIFANYWKTSWANARVKLQSQVHFLLDLSCLDLP